LGKPEESERVQSTQQAMKQYLAEELLVSRQGMVLVERTSSGLTRHGLMLALDLEQYDYTKGSQTLIRATEGTIIERLPPRMRIREGASLELPHILVLIDDPQRTVIEPVIAAREKLPVLYDTDLMLGSGHLTGHLLDNAAIENQVIAALKALADPQVFHSKYGVDNDKGVLLFAIGDGNHSLATAKAIWEKLKPQAGMDHPARYALVEIENVHDRGLKFEPIHRILFGVKEDIELAAKAFWGGKVAFRTAKNENDMAKHVDDQSGPQHQIGLVSSDGCQTISISEPASNLPVGTLQAFLDDWLKRGGAGKVDYVHGQDVVARLGSQPGNLGFYLPAMDKSDLFRTVILDGALPRKTFSMGEARDKRFYMECRRIA
ncbi:MAG TPA: DUF1015 domain-containing protein, partial [Longilinea sp.]|nr:DUF1015 domain-containing protein [Longilinea sp.]